jgi:DNA-binding Lrp family transcriptional regulator
MQAEEMRNEYLDEIEDGRNFEFFIVENDVIDREDLTWNEKLVYMAFCRYSSHTKRCFPSYNTLARKTGLSRDTVMRTVKSLIEKGLIHKTVRTVEGKNEPTSNLYVVKSAKTKPNLASSSPQPPSSSPQPPSSSPQPPSSSPQPPSSSPQPPPEILAPCNADATRVCDTPQNSYKDQSYKDLVRNTKRERTIQSVCPATGKNTKAFYQTTDRQTEKKVGQRKFQEQPKPHLPVYEVTEADIKHQIGYSALATLGDTSLLDEVVLNMFDMYHSSGVRIKDEVKPQAIVHNVLSKVTYWHIVYILDRFKQVTTPIKNKKGYLQTMIYTSVLEHQAHFTNEVQVDYLAWAKELQSDISQGHQQDQANMRPQRDQFEQRPELTDEELEKFYAN